MARQTKPNILYVSQSDYFDACDRLLCEIEKLISSKSLRIDSLIATARGGLIVGAYLASKLDMRLDVVYAKSYKGTQQGKLVVMIPEHIHRWGKRYLLVDDLFDTGITIRTVMGELMPAWVMPVTLFRKKQITGMTLIDQFAVYTKSWIQFFYEKEIV